MALICSSCGNPNNPQNKFCSACGTKLAADAQGRCPLCSAVNPETNIFCDECGARLVPARPAATGHGAEGSVRGLSLPSREPAGGEEAPDWLAQLRASFADEDELAVEADDESQEPELDAGAVAEAPETRTPDQELAAAETEFDLPALEDKSHLPDWLQEVMAHPPVASDAASSLPASDAGGAAPDWLQDFVEHEPAAGDSAGESDWQQPFSTPEPAGWPDQMPEEAAPAAFSGIELSPAGDDLPDWLRQVTDQETLPASAAGEEPEPDRPHMEPGKLPDWLQSVTDAAVAPEDAADDTTGIEPGELPDWLQAVSAPQILPEEESVQPEIEPGELPDWLQAPDQEPTPSPVEVVPDPGARGLPDWLTADEEEETSADPPIESGQLPDWLQAMAPQDEDEQAPPAVEPAKAAPQEPDWLLDDMALDADAPAMAMPTMLTPDRPANRPDREPPPPIMATGPLSPKDLTDWLGAAAGPGEADKQVTRDLSHTGPLVPPELPDWLAAVEDPTVTGQLPEWLTEETTASPAARPEPAAAPLPSWFDEQDGLGSLGDGDALPDWLQQLPQDAPGPELSPAELPDWLIPPGSLREGADLAEMEIPPADALGLAQADIPEWLQALKPAEIEEDVEEEVAETTGPLEGIRGALSIAGIITKQPRAATLPKFVITEQQQSHGRVLEQIVRAEPTLRPPAAAGRRKQAWLERGLLPLLILLAVLLPSILNTPLFVDADVVTVPSTVDAFDLLGALPESATVIVAFDYAPGQAGELNSLAATLLSHLMQRQARLVLVSTEPTGPELAQGVINPLAESLDYAYGEDYINLGYLPGGSAGLQAFATAPWELLPGSDFLSYVEEAQTAPAAAGLGNSLPDVDLILVLTAERSDLQGWLEQVGRLPGLRAPLAAGVSAALEIWAQPYYYNEPRQLAGLVSGIPGAAQYEHLLNGANAGPATDLRNNQTVGLIVIILFIIFGLLWSTLIGLTDRRQGHG